MSTTTFHDSVSDHASSQSLYAVGEFPVAWFQATPAFIILRPVAAFLAAWFQATPAGIVLRALSH